MIGDEGRRGTAARQGHGSRGAGAVGARGLHPLGVQPDRAGRSDLLAVALVLAGAAALRVPVGVRPVGGAQAQQGAARGAVGRGLVVERRHDRAGGGAAAVDPGGGAVQDDGVVEDVQAVQATAGERGLQLDRAAPFADGQRAAGVRALHGGGREPLARRPAGLALRGGPAGADGLVGPGAVEPYARAVGLGSLGQQGHREEDHRGGAPVRAGLQDDLDAVPLCEAADDEQAEPVGVGEFELGGLGKPEVRVEQRLRGHAEAAVVDLQGETVRHALAVHLDRGVRRREHRGVLQQFGDEVGDVGDGGADDAQAREAAHLDALVVLDLGDGGPYDVHQLDGLAPLTGGRGAGEDHQAFGVAAHAGGHVVEAEEVGQFLGVLGTAFHGVKEGQLAVQQHLVAAGQVDEHLGDSAAQVGLLDGGLDGCALEGVEGLADLADLVLLVLEVGCLGLHVHVFARREAAHHAGQPDAGGLVGLLAQPRQVADEVAADADGQDQGHDQGDEAEDAGGGGLDHHVHGYRLDALLVAVAGLGVHGGQVVEDPGRGLVPLGGGEVARLADHAAGYEPLLGVAQGLGLGRLPVLLEELPVLGGEGHEVELVEQRALRGEVGDVADVGRGDVARGERGGDDGVLAGEQFAGTADADEGAALLVDLHIVQAVEVHQEVVAGVDQPVVELQGLGGVEGVLVHGAAHGADALEGGDDRAQAVGALRAQLVDDLGVSGAHADLLDDHVGLGAALGEFGRGGGRPGVAEDDEGLAPFLLDDAGGVLDRVADLVDDVGHVEELDRLTAGDDRGEAPEGGQGDERHKEQRHDLPADGLPAKAHGLPSLPQVNPVTGGRCSVI